MKRIISGYYKQLYANKLDEVDEVNKFIVPNYQRSFKRKLII